MSGDSSYEPQLAAPVEEEFERTLRPRDFQEFLGQEALLEPLQVMIQAATGREEVLEHLLFAGQPGLGKTSLALALASEIGRPLKITSGPALERAKDLVGILSGLERGTVLFIDEIHRLPRVVEEYLYGAMERFQLEFTLDQGVHARLLKLELQPFTLVGATTREAMLTGAFRSRFGHVLHFEPYSDDALQRILERSAGLLGVAADPAALAELASRSRGVPRIANRLLRRARDVAQVEQASRLDLRVVARALDLLDIDAHGLERTDRRLLEVLARSGGRPQGLKTLAVAVGEAEDTLEDVYEPWLIRQGWIARTPQGRVLQDAGWRLLGLEPPAAANASAATLPGLDARHGG
ncbi:MAG TPA: Holliday junction branch migration DNA helicase RuvB [Planctomycetota bacterium]